MTILGSDGHQHEQLVVPVVPPPHVDVQPQVQTETRVVAPQKTHIVTHQTHIETPDLVQADASEFQSPSPVDAEKTESVFQIVKAKHRPSTEAGAELKKTMVMSLPAAGCQSVTLANRVGDITVLGTEDTQCRVEVKIAAKAKDVDTAKLLVDQVHITTSEDKQELAIKLDTPEHSDDTEVTVSFVLRIPQTLNLKLKTEVGNITVHHMQNQVDCLINVGHIRAQAEVKVLNANTNVGQIFLAVADDANAKISAQTNVGKIQSKHAFEMKPANMTGAKGTLILGSGSTPVNLKVNVGSIHVGAHSDMDRVGQPGMQSRTYQRTVIVQ